MFDEVWSTVQDLTDPISEEFVREFQASTLASPVPDRFFDQLVAESLRAPARVWQAAFAGIRTMPRDTPITAPTLLLWGDQDALVPRAEQDALLSAIPGAHLVVYKGTGHSPNWEQPERVAHDIETFLRRHALKGATLPFDTPPARLRHRHGGLRTNPMATRAPQPDLASTAGATEALILEDKGRASAAVMTVDWAAGRDSLGALLASQ